MTEPYLQFSAIEEAADYLKARITLKPLVGIVCGTGLGSLTNSIKSQQYVEYQDIPHFPVSTVLGHEGRLVFGHLENVPVVAMKGRCHFFEGYSLPQCCFPIRVLHQLGIKHLIVTNSAGGLSPSLKTGDVMIIRDHINLLGLAGTSPLIGLNDERFGKRFLPMAKAYSEDLIAKSRQIIADKPYRSRVKEGVYCCVAGPSYETVAEGQMLLKMGVDAVGMSTVHEVITARHCGLNVFGFSLITNMVAVDYNETDEPDHADIVDIGKTCEGVCSDIVVLLVKLLDS